ncbi:MAG TPA: hypothetical protein VFY90_08475 [Tepidiformaceae bacterium]|nr:hypothetical protein [Tepidiformaceae bacterium]
MNADPVRRYLELRAQLIKLTEETEQYLDPIRHAGVIFRRKGRDTYERDWKDAGVSNLGHQYPPSVKTFLDGKTWPSAQEIGDRLVAWHAANEETRSAWAEVPAELQSGLQKPPTS